MGEYNMGRGLERFAALLASVLALLSVFFVLPVYARCTLPASMIAAAAAYTNTGYLITILAAIAVIILLLFWSLTLKRTVAQKTSELVELYDTLKINEIKNKELLANLNIGVGVYSAGKELDIYNQAYQKLLGLDEDRAACWDFIGLDGCEISREEYPVERVMATGRAIHDYTLGIRRCGTESIIWVQANAFPEFDEAGKLLRVVETFADITAVRQAEARLYEMSIRDNLTGLYDRSYFENAIDGLQSAGLRASAMLICDVDGLKLINDAMGHPAGDDYLKATAHILQRSFRSQDIVARLGGDEFILFMPDISEAEVKELCAGFLHRISIFNSSNASIPLSISYGYSVREGSNISMREMFKEADNYMYRIKLHKRQSVKSELVQTMMKMLEARDFITEGHADRMQELASELAAAVGVREGKISDIRLLAQFHDIGKVGISDSILFKDGKLTDEEMREMKRHTEIGNRIAESSADLIPIADSILKHHEWWNGRGYPFGLKGESIPIECRILSIVDAYDAMVNDRPYRKALSKNAAVAELRRCSGTQFDPSLVQRFLEIV